MNFLIKVTLDLLDRLDNGLLGLSHDVSVLVYPV